MPKVPQKLKILKKNNHFFRILDAIFKFYQHWPLTSIKVLSAIFYGRRRRSTSTLRAAFFLVDSRRPFSSRLTKIRLKHLYSETKSYLFGRKSSENKLINSPTDLSLKSLFQFLSRLKECAQKMWVRSEISNHFSNISQVTITRGTISPPP